MSRPMPHAARVAGAGALVAALAVLVGACGPSTPGLTDAKEILGKGLANLAALKSFHVDVAVAGEVKLSFGGSSGSGVPIPLDGTTATGDVDLAGRSLSASASAPSLFNFKGDLVLVDDALYVKAPLVIGADTWQKQQLATGSVADAASDPAKLIDQLRAFLDRPGVAPVKQGDEKCGDTDCYKVSFTIPAAELNGAAGQGLSALPGGVTLGDVTAIAWVRRSDVRLAKLTADVSLGNMGSLSLTLSLSKFDVPVTITAPPADQVQEGPGG